MLFIELFVNRSGARLIHKFNVGERWKKTEAMTDDGRLDMLGQDYPGTDWPSDSNLHFDVKRGCRVLETPLTAGNHWL